MSGSAWRRHAFCSLRRGRHPGNEELVWVFLLLFLFIFSLHPLGNKAYLILSTHAGFPIPACLRTCQPRKKSAKVGTFACNYHIPAFSAGAKRDGGTPGPYFASATSLPRASHFSSEPWRDFGSGCGHKEISVAALQGRTGERLQVVYFCWQQC